MLAAFLFFKGRRQMTACGFFNRLYFKVNNNKSTKGTKNEID